MGNELTDHHYTQLNESSQREFHLRLPAKPELSDRLYFLLVETETENILLWKKFLHREINRFSFLIRRFGNENVMNPKRAKEEPKASE